MNTNEETKQRSPGFWLHAIKRRKRQLGREYVSGLGETAREGISDEDYATTMATLEKMARNLGWDESQPDERAEVGRGGRGMHRHGRRGHGRGFGRPSRNWAPEA